MVGKPDSDPECYSVSDNLPTRPYVRKVEYNLLQVNRGLGPICLGGVFSAADGLWPAPCSVVPPTESGRGTAFTALGLANVGIVIVGFVAF